MLPCHVEGRARQCKTLQGCGRSGKSFLVSLRGVLQLVRTPVTQEVAGSSPVAPAKFLTPVNTRLFSLSPHREIVIKKPFCQKFAKSRRPRSAPYSANAGTIMPPNSQPYASLKR